MKIGIIQTSEGSSLAAIYGDSWVSIPNALSALEEPSVNEMAAFIDAWCDRIPELNDRITQLVQQGRTETYPLADAQFLPPLPSSPKLLTSRGNSCVHKRARKSNISAQPSMDHRYNFNLVGHNSVYYIGRGAPEFTDIGWNYEMIVVMGKPCHGVSKENVDDYIFGYTNMLDVGGGFFSPFYKQWTTPEEDKIFDDYAYEDSFNGNARAQIPVGPWITTKDEVGDPHDQLIEERESGRLVSMGSAQAVVWTIPEMVSYASGFLLLEPGDMISTASITYDGYNTYPGHYPENAYIQGGTKKLGTLRMWIQDERKEI